MEKKTLINWFEIPAVDFERAVKFYSVFLGYKLEVCDWGEEKMAFFPENECNIGGAVSWAKDFNPSEDGVVIYFNAGTKLDEMLSNLENLGGSIIRGKTKIEAEGRGHFALIKDSEGNRIGLYEA